MGKHPSVDTQGVVDVRDPREGGRTGAQGISKQEAKIQGSCRKERTKFGRLGATTRTKLSLTLPEDPGTSRDHGL